MKNKVIRLALVSILVVAMVLSMAACEKKDPTPTPTPTPTAATPTPVVTPSVTPVPTTPAPATGSDNEKALAKYGIKLENANATYTSKEKDQLDVKFVVDIAGLAKKGTVITVGNSTTALSKDNLDDVLEKADYEGSHPNLASATLPVSKATIETDDFKGFKIRFVGAGTYTIEIPVVVTTKNAAFGGKFEKEAVVDEYTLTATIVVSKKDVALSAKDKAIVVEPKATTITFGTPNLTDEVLEDMVGYDKVTRKLTVTSGIKGYIDGTVAGEYEVVNAFQINGKDVDEAPEFKNHNVTLGNSKLYILTKEQFTNVKDITTTLTGDANVLSETWSTTEAAVVAALPAKAPYARVRYDALSVAEKAWFNYNWLKGTDNDQAFFADDTRLVDESKLVTTLVAAEKTAAETKVVDDFVKIIKDSKLPTASNFNIANVEHVAAFNAVLAAHNALSKVDKALVETAAVDGDGDEDATIENNDYIARFKAASVQMNGIPVKAVQELIDGAIGAYHKALVNLGVVGSDLAEITPIKIGGKYYYKSTASGAKYFISNSEVVSITNQAKAAYDKLTKDQQAMLGNPVIATTSTFNTFTTAKDILGALVSMNERVTYMAQVVDYINIQDYSTKGEVFKTLNAVVYGDSFFIAAGAGNGAMKDLASTKTSNYEEIITEYKAWVDAVLAVENYKNAKIDAFKAQLASTVTTANYKENEAFYNALNKDVYANIVKAITNEQAINSIGDTTDPVIGTALTVGATPANIYSKWFNATGKANAETVKELYADLEVASWDAESLVDKYIKALAKASATKLADAE